MLDMFFCEGFSPFAIANSCFEYVDRILGRCVWICGYMEKHDDFRIFLLHNIHCDGLVADFGYVI